MKILVINTGSSSIKYRLFDMGDESILASGMIEKIGEAESRLAHVYRDAGGSWHDMAEDAPVADHRAGMARIAALLTDADRGVVRDTSEIAAVGHRVVHGGEEFRGSAIIGDAVLEAIRACVPLAPLHNPPNLTGIAVARELFPDAPHAAVFDTAFHQTIPRHAFHYAIPRGLYEKHRVRRFGFHGTSHRYVAREAARVLGMPPVVANLITIHLGNGASITAVAGGKSVDTSMGMTPLEGLVMGTRCGDIDPAVPFYLARNTGMSLDGIENILNKESGLKGLCGMNDMREVMRRRSEGGANAQLAVEMYTYRIKKYIGAYLAVLGRAHAIVFTGGIGENAAEIRALSCRGLESLGIAIDESKNASYLSGNTDVATPDSRVRILIIPTNEELEIARQTRDLLEKNK